MIPKCCAHPVLKLIKCIFANGKGSMIVYNTDVSCAIRTITQDSLILNMTVQVGYDCFDNLTNALIKM